MYKKTMACLIALTLSFIGCASKIPSTNTKNVPSQKETQNIPSDNSKNVILGIHETTVPQDLKSYQNLNPLNSLPKYDPNAVSSWPIDLRSRDISKFDLTGRTYDLLHSTFNSETIWPENLPQGFNPDKIMEINKTPGLNIKKLHEKGITGNGVGVAIIDFPLVLDHVEYKDKIKFYEHIHYPDNMAHFHGPMVTSIAMGNNIGVAPGASLYFIANFSSEKKDGKIAYNYNYTAQAIRRLIEVNASLSKKDKIRVLSISMGWEPEQTGYSELLKAIEEANRDGIFVVSCNLFQQNNQFFFHGLYKEALDDPDDFEVYKPYSWEKWIAMVKKPFYKFDTFYEKEYGKAKNKKVLLIPMGGITAATATGDDDYEYAPDGGWSSAIPYIAGLYAMTCQVKPDITPEEFWKAAYETGASRTIEKDGRMQEARIPVPEKLIQYLQKE